MATGATLKMEGGNWFIGSVRELKLEQRTFIFIRCRVLRGGMRGLKDNIYLAIPDASGSHTGLLKGQGPSAETSPMRCAIAISLKDYHGKRRVLSPLQPFLAGSRRTGEHAGLEDDDVIHAAVVAASRIGIAAEGDTARRE